MWRTMIAAIWLTIAVGDPVAKALLTGQDVKAKAASRRPSILLILPDQMRGQDLGCMGNPEVRTPNLDRLASQGVLFRNTFANTPVCCPARAIILTGKYAHENGMVANDLRLRESETTLAEILAAQGYRTGFIGKWHLDGGKRLPGFVPPGPRRQGFEFWAANECDHRHFRPTYFRDTDRPITEDRFEPEVWTDRAIEFLKQAGDEPVLPGRRHGAAPRPLRGTRGVHEALRPGEADDAAQLGRGRAGRGPQGDGRLLCGDHRRR